MWNIKKTPKVGIAEMKNHLRRAVATIDATTWRRLRVSNSPGRWHHTVTRTSSTRTSNSLQNEDSTSLYYNTTQCSYTFDYLCKFISDNKINNFQSRHARTPKTLYHICIYNVQPQWARTTRGNTLRQLHRRTCAADDSTTKTITIIINNNG